MSNAFDAVAADYDRSFTTTPLAQALRAQVWARLGAHFRSGDHVLELNCGTGADAVWLAQRGVRVTATDLSTAMLDVTGRKALTCGVSELIETRRLDLAAPAEWNSAAGKRSRLEADLTYQPADSSAGGQFDGAFSNFGGLNCVEDLQLLAAWLADVIKPRGALILVPLNRWCAWEIGWHVLHGQPRTAFRRLQRGGVQAIIGSGTLRVWYPSLATLRRVFAPQFQLQRVSGLGVCLPPSYLEPAVQRRPALFRRLRRIDQATHQHWPFKRLADHLILEFERST